MLKLIRVAQTPDNSTIYSVVYVNPWNGTIAIHHFNGSICNSNFIGGEELPNCTDIQRALEKLRNKGFQDVNIFELPSEDYSAF